MSNQVFRLTENEINELSSMHRTTNDKSFAYQINVLLLMIKGYTPTHIADLLLINSQDVINCIERYKSGGVRALKRRGFKRLLNLIQSNTITLLLQLALVCFAVFLISYPIHSAINDIANTHGNRHDSDFIKLLKLPESRYQVINYINNSLPKNSTVLSFDQSDLAYYGKRRFISEFDPMLLDFYQSNTLIEAYSSLKKLDVNYIYLPPFAIPEILNSKILDITANPTLTTLVFQSHGYKLFKLHYLNTGSDPISKYYILWNPVSPLKADITTLLYKKEDDLPKSNSLNPPFLLKIDIQGEGLADLYIVEKSAQGNILRKTTIWEGMLKKNRTSIQTQFLLIPETQQVQLQMTVNEPGYFKINAIELYKPKKFSTMLYKALK